jgi:hypothetical protein
LHTELYAMEAVEQAKAAFDEVCEAEISREGAYLLVELTAKGEEDETRLAGEFANHALALTVESARNRN